MRGIRIRLRKDDVHRGDPGARDEALAAVQDVVVAVEPCRRPHRCAVGARLRLRQRIRGEPLAAGEPRQEALLLLVVPGKLDAKRAELLHREDQSARRADFRELFDEDEGEQRALPDPAVGLREEHPEEVVLAKELDDVPRELPARVDLRRPRRDPLAREHTHEIANLALLVGQRIEGAHPALQSRPAVADTGAMLVPVRIFTLVVVATGVACAAMTLILLLAARR